jgi:hypothetical protein
MQPTPEAAQPAGYESSPLHNLLTPVQRVEQVSAQSITPTELFAVAKKNRARRNRQTINILLN